MESTEAKTRAIENAREPIRQEVYLLISKKITEHSNVLDGDMKVKYYFPSHFKWELKTVECRKTQDGEEKVVLETHIECAELEWLIAELKEKKYNVELKAEPGYVYGKYPFMEIAV